MRGMGMAVEEVGKVKEVECDEICEQENWRNA